MNIQTVAENLRNTIAGKEEMLDAVKYVRDMKTGEARLKTTLYMLEINIAELKRILQDVEQCVAKDVEQSWRDNPDRSGGQFTQDEINRAGEWR